MNVLPHKGPYCLSIDRTNWKFGQANINALVLAITYQGVAFPILLRVSDTGSFRTRYKEIKLRLKE